LPNQGQASCPGTHKLNLDRPLWWNWICHESNTTAAFQCKSVAKNRHLEKIFSADGKNFDSCCELPKRKATPQKMMCSRLVFWHWCAPFMVSHRLVDRLQRWRQRVESCSTNLASARAVVGAKSRRIKALLRARTKAAGNESAPGEYGRGCRVLAAMNVPNSLYDGCLRRRARVEDVPLKAVWCD
jgi:hypothetical protein